MANVIISDNIQFTTKQQAVKSMRNVNFSHQQIANILSTSKYSVWMLETTKHIALDPPIQLTSNDIDYLCNLRIRGKKIGVPHRKIMEQKKEE